MKSFMLGKRRLLLAGVVAASLGGGAYAFAANLNVSSTSLSAGTASVASCNSSAALSYTTAYDISTSKYVVASLTITSGSGCNGKAVKVTEQGNNVEFTSTLDSSGSYTWDATHGTPDITTAASPTLDANTVSGLAVVITG